MHDVQELNFIYCQSIPLWIPLKDKITVNGLRQNEKVLE